MVKLLWVLRTMYRDDEILMVETESDTDMKEVEKANVGDEARGRVVL